MIEQQIDVVLAIPYFQGILATHKGKALSQLQ